LASPTFSYGYDPVFEDARLEPFTDQTDDALVADAVLQEADQPVMVDAAKRLLDRLPTTALIISTTIPIR
jgi:hypothetical protein